MLLALVGAVARPGIASESTDRNLPELVTDRPDQTESSILVPPGFVQLESGWTFTHEDEGGVRVDSHALPGTLVRIGIVDELELRVGWAGYLSEESKEGGVEVDADGAGDAEIGVKLHLWGPGPYPQARDELAPSSGAIIVSSSLPIGADEFTSDRFDPSFRFSASHSLAADLSLGYNVGMIWESRTDPSGGRDTLSDYFYTVALGFGDIAPRVSAFVELFGEIPASAPGGPRHSLDGGFTFLVRPNLQLDLFGGVGLSEDADDWFAGAGISVRLPD
jgi:hypothetical protein